MDIRISRVFSLCNAGILLVFLADLTSVASLARCVRRLREMVLCRILVQVLIKQSATFVCVCVCA